MARKVEYTAKGVRLNFDKTSATKVARGHSSHKSGAGTHGMRKPTRTKGVNAKRAWLDSND